MSVNVDNHKEALLQSLLDEARAEADVLRKELARMRQILMSSRLVMGHELKKPATAISGYLDLVCDDLEQSSTSKTLDYAKKARAECKSLAELNAFFVELLRVDVEEPTVGTRVVNVPALVKEVLNQLPERLNARARVELRTMGEKELTVAFNRDALRLIVANLIENALLYSQSKQPIRVEVEKVPEKRGLGGYDILKLRVADQGVGIPKENLKVICNPFVRLREDVAGGSGLGLTLVRSLVELGGGNLFIRSASGAGTTVHVTLPDNPDVVRTA